MRQIIHLDLDAFYASVEILLNPEWRGKPLIVAMGEPRGRGVVATASYEARPFGVRSAMPLREALRLCPQAVVVPVRHPVYREHSRRVMNLLSAYSPLVEQVSIDEAYIEIAPEVEAAQIAREIQERITLQFGLSATVAVASNKLVSKIACNTVKPRGFVSVPPAHEQEFLAPLPIHLLPGAGKVTRAKLMRWSVRTIGDLTRVPLDELRAEFGKNGIYLSEAAHGRDDSPIVTESRPKSISEENTFEHDTRDPKQVEAFLMEMSQGVGLTLQREGYLARTLVLKLRYADFTTITRQETLHVPTAEPKEILARVKHLLNAHWDRRRALRLVGIGAHNVVERSGAWQLEFGLDA